MPVNKLFASLFTKITTYLQTLIISYGMKTIYQK